MASESETSRHFCHFPTDFSFARVGFVIMTKLKLAGAHLKNPSGFVHFTLIFSINIEKLAVFAKHRA